MKRILAIAIALLSVACGSSSSPSTTSPPAQLRWNLSGTVTSVSTRTPIGGALVSIVDGPNAGQRTTTEPNGRYAFADLVQSGFTLRVTATDYDERAQSVTLTASTVLDVQLPGLARLIFGGPIIFTPRSEGFDLRTVGNNTGTGCASTVAGVTVLTRVSTGETLSFAWSLPATRIIQIGERFESTIGSMTADQALRFQGASNTTSATFANTACS